MEEYEKEGLGGHVIIKAADDALDDQLPSIDSEYRMGYNLTKEILAGPRKVTAFAGLNDMMAFGIMDALQEENIRFPAMCLYLAVTTSYFPACHICPSPP